MSEYTDKAKPDPSNSLLRAERRRESQLAGVFVALGVGKTSQVGHCGLVDGSENGIFFAMKTTIDHAGRLVIPKDIRRESGIKPGMPLEIRWEKGSIAITPAPLTVKLERQGRLLVAVPTENTSPLTSDTVERTRRTLRKERSGAST